jgi:hypothetical protein
MHRFIWDLRYSGKPAVPALAPTSRLRPRSPKPGEKDAPQDTQPRLPTGPVAPPGTYTVEMKIGAATSRQPLTIAEDPRITASGVTDADLEELFAHNMRVLKLVNDANLDVVRVTSAMARLKQHPDAAREKALKAIADRLITPKVRYSQPGLQTHVTYLYDETNGSDQKVGADAVARYGQLRAQIDAITAELDRVLGLAKPGAIQAYLNSSSTEPPRAAEDDEEE